ncbi:hypothetical protein SKAU_G00034470 [Synaphobranchus kaupii]|uniref:Uncharacterized protein n=1 Tax=Synaphobranchus kaupii TaxID=118154 RepID=A0A9Q1GEH1_SYNKA|nr:hypothetical protein SKAU_G00034470 [Synaphobranchus kaupii]
MDNVKSRAVLSICRHRITRMIDKRLDLEPARLCPPAEETSEKSSRIAYLCVIPVDHPRRSLEPHITAASQPEPLVSYQQGYLLPGTAIAEEKLH